MEGEGYTTPPSSPRPNESELVKNFRKGDLLYGLEKEARQRYMSAITTALSNTEVLCTADRYNNKFLCQLVDKSKQEFEIKFQKLMEDYAKESDENSQSLSSYGNQIVGNIKKKNPTYFDEERTEQELFKKFCKEAIDYTVENGHTIHFLIDELDVPAIFKEKESRSALGKSYTASELRYIKKNWDQLKDHVIFYRSGSKVGVPWK